VDAYGAMLPGGHPCGAPARSIRGGQKVDVCLLMRAPHAMQELTYHLNGGRRRRARTTRSGIAGTGTVRVYPTPDGQFVAVSSGRGRSLPGARVPALEHDPRYATRKNAGAPARGAAELARSSGGSRVPCGGRLAAERVWSAPSTLRRNRIRTPRGSGGMITTLPIRTS